MECSVIIADYVEFEDYVLYNTFADGIIAALTLRSFYQPDEIFDREQLREKLVDKIGLKSCSIASAEQVHGNLIAYVGRTAHLTGVDGLATDQPGVVLTAVVADCLPIYLWSRKRRCIALLHAGWRGTADGIASTGVDFLGQRFGIAPNGLTALLGPCICSECYEVGPEVADRFDQSVLRKGRSDRYFLDLRGENLRQLVNSGVAEDAIMSDGRCTCCLPELFYSYRGDGKKAGRMFAALALLPDRQTAAPGK